MIVGSLSSCVQYFIHHSSSLQILFCFCFVLFCFALFWVLGSSENHKLFCVALFFLINATNMLILELIILPRLNIYSTFITPVSIKE